MWTIYLKEFLLKFVFEKLPKRHQEIIQLRLKEQKTFKEIATEKEIPLNTCLGQYRHAITCLKKIINRQKVKNMRSEKC
jgi:RNA polymerase sigma-70 factor (ECF subfamily)